MSSVRSYPVASTNPKIEFDSLDIVVWAELDTIDLALLNQRGGEVKLAAQLEDALRGYGT